jgi:hypothetical protein
MSIAFMGTSDFPAARNIRNDPDEVGSSTLLILAVLQENHTSNLSAGEILKTAKMGCGKSAPYSISFPEESL